MAQVERLRPDADAEDFFRDLIELINRHSSAMIGKQVKDPETPYSLEIMLALAAQIVGRLMSMQDHDTISLERVMVLVQMNIDQGSKQYLEEQTPTAGNA
jgi:hypothetical protein